MNFPLLFPASTGHRRVAGFTLIEMLITMVIFILLAASVFGVITGVIESASILQDNQNHRDQVEALQAFLKKKLGGLSAQSTFLSYQRRSGDGSNQNGIIMDDLGTATAIDATVQANGYHTLRLVSLTVADTPNSLTSPLAVLETLVLNDDPSLSWTPLIRDVRQIDWKFQDLNNTQWVDAWKNPTNKPNLVEFTIQLAGDLQPATMDFWFPRIGAVSVIPALQTAAPPASPTPPSHGN